MLGNLAEFLIDGRYRLAREIGRGGFGVVYEAYELVSGEFVGTVAVKLVPLSSREEEAQTVRRRLVQEIRTMAQFPHQCLIAYKTSGEITDGAASGNFYIVMELAEEGSLAKRLSGGRRLSDAEARECIRDVAEALAYLHRRQQVHGDVKPANILRCQGRWKLSDFGLARAIHGHEIMISGAVGTPYYMAPEVLEGQFGMAADVFSLGAVAYQCLTGRPAHWIAGAQPDFAELTEPWDDLLPRMLSHEPGKRPGAEEVRACLETTDPTSARVTAPATRPEAPTTGDAAGLTSDLGHAAHPPPDGRAAFPEDADVMVNQKDGTILILVPAGDYPVGGPERDQGFGRFLVHLPAYYMAAHPVTNEQYRRFAEATGHRVPDEADLGRPVWRGGSFPPDRADHPVVCVNWDDACAYLEWAGLRLPTELEWEAAARGPRGYTYPWGDEWDPGRCHHHATGTCGIWDYPLGRSHFGLYNMVGNCNERCADWYDDGAYDRYRVGDTTPPPTGVQRVLRGGAWFRRAPEMFACCYRHFADPGLRLDGTGIRAARDA